MILDGGVDALCHPILQEFCREKYVVYRETRLSLLEACAKIKDSPPHTL